MTISTIFQYYQYCMRILDTNHPKLEYKTKKFKEAYYYGHKQVIYKSKLKNCQQTTSKL